MSSAKAALSASSTMALPPYLTTTVVPWKRSSQGSASMSTAALQPGCELGGHVEYAEFSWT